MAELKQIYCNKENTCFSIPLEKKKIIKKTLAGIVPMLFFVCWAFFFFGGLIFSAILGARLVLWSTAFLVILFFGFLCLLGVCLLYTFQCFYYKYYFYDLNQEEVIIRKGVISRREITLPYSRIQNVFVDQDFLDRIFGLYDVHIETAGMGSGMAAHIDGVNRVNADKLREILMTQIKKKPAGQGL